MILVHIKRGAIIHDLGKMAIPDNILHKPGPLNDEEWEINEAASCLSHMKC